MHTKSIYTYEQEEKLLPSNSSDLSTLVPVLFENLLFTAACSQFKICLNLVILDWQA